MRSLLWILDENGEPKPVEDPLEWARSRETEDRRIDETLLSGSDGEYSVVSTIFLGIDSGFCSIPILWETMVFGGKEGKILGQERYSSREASLVGHKEWVERMTKVHTEEE